MLSESSPTVLLIGCGPTTSSALESLATHLTIYGLVRDCDPAAPDSDPVVRRASELGIPVTTETSLEVIEQLIDRLHPDCVVISSYSRILPGRIISKARFINVHYALLPRYRGRANVNWAVINGERETGITIHALCPDLDAGNILFQQAVPIESTDTVNSLYELLNAIQKQELGLAVLHHLQGYEGEPQDDSAATYGCTRLPQDGEIDWAASSHRVYDLIRALSSPYPGAFTYLHGEPLTIWHAKPVTNPRKYDGRIPGRVIGLSRNEGWVDVLTGDGVIRLYEVQFRNAPSRPAAELIRSVKCTLGLNVSDLLKRIRALEMELTKQASR